MNELTESNFLPMWNRVDGITFAVSLLTIVLSLGCGSTGGSSVTHADFKSPSGEVVYVLDGVTVMTYNVDGRALTVSSSGSAIGLAPTSSSVLQLTPSPDDHFLYMLWMDNQQQEHLSTYATDVSGVPQVPALQTLNVSSQSQINIDATGKFAYTMHLQDLGTAYISTIFLWTIEPSGTFNPSAVPQGTYGPSVLPTQLYGINPNGHQLYLVSQEPTGPVYWQRKVNRQNGRVGENVVVLRPSVRDSIVFGASLIIDYRSVMNARQPRYVDVFANEPTPSGEIVHCTSAMLEACGTASNVQLDPSGKYLFVTDPALQSVRVERIDLQQHLVSDTGSAMPFTAQTPGFAFSPDGTLVYALLASDQNLHIYHFDQRRGSLTESGNTIPMSSSAGFAPALRR